MFRYGKGQRSGGMTGTLRPPWRCRLAQRNGELKTERVEEKMADGAVHAMKKLIISYDLSNQ